MYAHSPGAILQWLAKRDVQVAGKAGVDARFGHHRLLHGVQALLRVKCGHFTAIAADHDGALVRDEVRPLEVLGALEQEVVATQLHAFARRHAQVALGAVVAGQHHAQRTHRQAQVRQLHAPVAAAQARQAFDQALVAGLVENVTQPAKHYPRSQGEGRQRRPIEVVDDKAGNRSKDGTADQHWGHHAGQPFARGVLPAHHHAHAHHHHQQRHQRQEQGVEVGRADR
ncbi:hypothetical protein D3C75_813360 [compost metagenome]